MVITPTAKMTGKCLAVLGLVGVLTASAAMGQQVAPAASATEVTQSSGRPSTIQIKQNFLEQQLAFLQRQIDDAQRCIANSSNPTILRDPEGNLNRVPKTDLVNCTRQLAQLQDQLARLQRQSQQLAQDAQVQAAAVQRKLQQARTRAILQAVSGQ